MMIANWIHDSVTSQVVITRLSAFFPVTPVHDNEFAGAIRRVMPRSATGRSRKA